MAIRVKHTVAVRTARDTAFTKPMWNPTPDLEEVVMDTFDKQASGNFAIPAATTESIPFGDIDAVKGIYLETNAACTVRVNGSLDDIELVPHTTVTAQPAKLFLEANISAVEIENTSADTVLTGVYVLWGDPTP